MLFLSRDLTCADRPTYSPSWLCGNQTSLSGVLMTPNGMTKNALHLATHSGWYRFEQQKEDWVQADRALTYWAMSCIQVDPDNPQRVYIGTEHSGLSVTNDGGKEWLRAEPNAPCLTF